MVRERKNTVDFLLLISEEMKRISKYSIFFNQHATNSAPSFFVSNFGIETERPRPGLESCWWASEWVPHSPYWATRSLFRYLQSNIYFFKFLFSTWLLFVRLKTSQFSNHRWLIYSIHLLIIGHSDQVWRRAGGREWRDRSLGSLKGSGRHFEPSSYPEANSTDKMPCSLSKPDFWFLWDSEICKLVPSQVKLEEWSLESGDGTNWFDLIRNQSNLSAFDQWPADTYVNDCNWPFCHSDLNQRQRRK